LALELLLQGLATGLDTAAHTPLLVTARPRSVALELPFPARREKPGRCAQKVVVQRLPESRELFV